MSNPTGIGAGRRWTDEEKAECARLRGEGVTLEDIASMLAARFGKSFKRETVCRQLERMGKAGVREVPVTAAPPPTADRFHVDKSPSYPPGGSTFNLTPLDLGSSTPERILLIPDTHTPFHDPYAWELVMRFARQWCPHTVIHLGDWADCFSISDHDKDPRRGTQLEEEAKVLREQREEVEALKARNVISLGNHCDRLRRYITQRAPALLGTLTVESVFGWDNGLWTVVPYAEHGAIGKLHFTHDADYAGVHSVYHTGMAFAASVAFGHNHRLATYYFADILGRQHVACSLGWLGKLDEAKYAKRVNKRFWTHGFGTAVMLPGGEFTLQPLPIVNRKIITSERIVTLQ